MTLAVGDNAIGKKIKAGAGGDNVRTGAGELINTVDSAGGALIPIYNDPTWS